MTPQEKQRIKVEIISSISIVLLISMVITLTDSCYQHIFNIREIVNKDNVLMTVVTISGLMLGFLITTFTLKLGQLDNKIEKHAEAINSIIFTDKYKKINITENEINTAAEFHLQTLDGLDHKDFTKLYNDYKGLCRYRHYNKNWTWYPMIWNIRPNGHLLG